MKLETFFNNFDRFADSALGIPLLRQTILQFAVQGRLVKQSAEDTPAHFIVQRVLRARRQSGSASSSNVQANGQNGDRSSSEIPSGWSKCLVEDAFNVTDYVANGSFESLKQNVRASNEIDYAVLVRTTDGVNDWKGPFRYVDKSSFEYLSKSEVKPGDIIISSVGNPGQVFTVPDLGRSMTIGPNAVLVIPRDEEILRSYLSVFFRSPFAQSIFRTLSAGTAVQKFSKTVFRASPFLLPPLAEQKRIVAKVDELMALCDRLEAQQQERDEQASQLARASLARFADAPTPDNLEYLFHSSFIIPPSSLRRSILTLAVQGKLVPQDPNDEPAEEVLARTAATKLRLQKSGEIAKEKPFEPLQSDNLPFEAPESWRWAKLAELTELITKGSSPKWQGIAYVSESEGILFITSENVGNYVLRKLDDLKYVSKGFNEIEPRSILKRGDILMNLVGASIGRTAVYDLHDGANINQAVALIRLVRETDGVCPRFLLHYLNSPSAIDYMLSSRVVNAQPNISLTDAREFAVPIPPLAEQRRIVAKVEQLMALVDALEQQLAASRATAANLLSALVAELTVGGDQ